MSAALLLNACEGELCDGNCPDITGVYEINTVNVVGACPFAPLTLGPTITIDQSEDGRRVFAEFIDPSNYFRVSIAGRVTLGKDEDPADGGGFVAYSRYARQGAAEGDELDVLDVVLTGSVNVSDGRRYLTGYVSTRKIVPDFCSVSLTFTGIGPYVSPP